MDPELAALLAQLDAPSAPPPPPGAKKASPAFGGGLKKAPASFSSGVGAPPPPPMTGKFGAVPKSPAGSAAGLAVRGSSVGVGAAPPPPPLTGLGKATSSVVAGAGAPKAPPPGSFGKSGGGVVSPPSAPVASRSSYASPSSSTAQLKVCSVQKKREYRDLATFPVRAPESCNFRERNPRKGHTTIIYYICDDFRAMKI